jgi:hypothetical protein
MKPELPRPTLEQLRRGTPCAGSFASTACIAARRPSSRACFGPDGPRNCSRVLSPTSSTPAASRTVHWMAARLRSCFRVRSSATNLGGRPGPCLPATLDGFGGAFFRFGEVADVVVVVIARIPQSQEQRSRSQPEALRRPFGVFAASPIAPSFRRLRSLAESLGRPAGVDQARRCATVATRRPATMRWGSMSVRA